MNNIHADKFIQQGWECPKCGAILAPHQNYCPFCSREKYSIDCRETTSGQYVNPNPSETISDVGKTTTNAKDAAYTVKSYSHDGIRVLEEEQQ